MHNLTSSTSTHYKPQIMHPVGCCNEVMERGEVLGAEGQW